MNGTEICAACMYFYQFNDTSGNGFCKRHSPKVTLIGNGTKVDFETCIPYWPSLPQDTLGCGDFE